MSTTTPLLAEDALKSPDHRKYPRRQPGQLTYIDIGTDNGGVLLNVSETGVEFQGIRAMRDGYVVEVSFTLPGTNFSIRAKGQFVRSGTSHKSGGLMFVDLPAEARVQIRRWVAREEQATASGEDAGAISSEAGSKPSAAEAWINSLRAKREGGANRFSPVPRAEATSAPAVLGAAHDAQIIHPEPAVNAQDASQAENRAISPAVAITAVEATEPVATPSAEREGPLTVESARRRKRRRHKNKNASTGDGASDVATKPAAEESRSQAAIASLSAAVAKSVDVESAAKEPELVSIAKEAIVAPTAVNETDEASNSGHPIDSLVNVDMPQSVTADLTPIASPASTATVRATASVAATVPVGVARADQPARAGSRIWKFRAGVAAGWLMVTAIGVALVATAHLHPAILSAPTAAPSASTDVSDMSFPLQTLDLNHRRWTIAMPSPGRPTSRVQPRSSARAAGGRSVAGAAKREPSRSVAASSTERLLDGNRTPLPALEVRAPAIAQPAAPPTDPDAGNTTGSR